MTDGVAHSPRHPLRIHPRCCAAFSRPHRPRRPDGLRERMVDTRSRTRHHRLVRPERDAPRPTDLFVPERYASGRTKTPLPIGYGQTISQPYIVAYMTEALSCPPRTRCSRSAQALATSGDPGRAGARSIDGIVPESRRARPDYARLARLRNVFVRHATAISLAELRRSTRSCDGAPDEMPQPSSIQLAMGGTLVAQLVKSSSSDGHPPHATSVSPPDASVCSSDGREPKK